MREKDKKTNNVQYKGTQKTKILNNMNPTKTGGELMWAEMVSSYWSTCDTACVTVKRHHMIGKLS